MTRQTASSPSSPLFRNASVFVGPLLLDAVPDRIIWDILTDHRVECQRAGAFLRHRWRLSTDVAPPGASTSTGALVPSYEIVIATQFDDQDQPLTIIALAEEWEALTDTPVPECVLDGHRMFD